MQPFYDGERLIGAPSLTVREDQPAIVTMSTDNGYSMRLVAPEEPLSAQHGRRVTVTTEVFFRFLNRWAPVASPSFTIPVSKSASFTLPGSGRTDKATRDPFKLNITVSDNSRALS